MVRSPASDIGTPRGRSPHQSDLAEFDPNSANARGAGTRLLSLTGDSGAGHREDWCYL